MREAVVIVVVALAIVAVQAVAAGVGTTQNAADQAGDC